MASTYAAKKSCSSGCFDVFLNEQSFNKKKTTTMPRTPEQFYAMQEESRAGIIQAALELFAEYGFDRTSVGMIAKRANISQGLMYNYFTSKEALLQAIFQRGWVDVQASFRVEPPHGVPAATLYDFIEQTCRLVVQHQTFWRLIHIIRSQPAIIRILSKELQDFENMILGQIELFCQRSGSENPKAEAWLLFAFVDGITTHLVRQPDAYPLNEVLALIKPMYSTRKI
jgi:AcrR family transcriptional regulator